MKYFCAILCASSLLLVACNQNRGEIGAKQTVIRDSDFKQVEASQSVLSKIGIVDTLFLQSNDESKYLLSSIDKVIWNNDSYYVFDKRNRPVLMFDSEGAPIGKIGEIGRGPKEYLQINDFCIDNVGNVWIIDARQDKIYCYDKGGSFISATSTKKKQIEQLSPVGDNLFLVGIAPWDNTDAKGIEIAETGTDFTKVNSIVKYSEDIDLNVVFPNPGFMLFLGKTYYNRPVSDIIYVFNNRGKIDETIDIDFSGKEVPDNIKTDLEGGNETLTTQCAFVLSGCKINKNYLMVNNSSLIL